MNYFEKLYSSLQARIVRSAPDGLVMVEAAHRVGSGGPVSSRIHREARSLQAKTLRELKNAVLSASDPEMPDFQLLEELHVNLLMDNHLSSVIESRILHTQRSQIKMVSDAGKENPDITWLLERPWFAELIEHYLMSRFRGRQLLELYDLNEADELETVTRIPQSHFNVRDGIILKEPGDVTGVPYREGRMADFYVQVGRNDDLGMLTEMATAILAKKLGFGSWLDYIDKYGVPPLFITTDREDTKRLNELAEAAASFKSNNFMVGRGQENFTIPNTGMVDAYNTFDRLIERVNSEISKRVLGGSGTSDEKAHVGSAEIQFRLAKDRYEADKNNFKHFFNTRIRPRLVKLSTVYAPLANHYLEWDDTETLDQVQYIDAVTKLATSFVIDPDKVSERTGIDIIGHKNYGETTGTEGGTPPKKPEAVLDQDGVWAIYKYRKQLTALYHGPECACTACTTDKVIAIDTEGWVKVMERIARETYEGKLKRGQLDDEYIVKTYNELNEGISKGYGKDWLRVNKATGSPAPETLKMQANLFRFSGAKNHAMLLELNDNLSKNGRLSTWDEFRTAALKLNSRYNQNYLQAEWQTARQPGLHAQNWQEYQRNKERYPNLRYRTQEDDRVREEHDRLRDIVKPVDDPFWDSYYPPNGWRCRCYTVQTAAKSTAEDKMPRITDKDVKPEFKVNPGKGGQVYKEDTAHGGKPHPYFMLARKQGEGFEKRINRQILRYFKSEAKKKLLPKKVRHPDLEKHINFNATGLKEAFNQPHEQKESKNLLIPYMDSIIPVSEYLGFVDDIHNNPMIKGSHIFKYVIEEKESFIIMRENVDGEINFYSISDNPKVALGAKK